MAKPATVPSVPEQNPTTALIPKEQLDELRALSGEGMVFQRPLALDIIAVDADRQIFTTSKPDPNNDDERLTIDMGPTFSGVILRIRMRLNLTVGKKDKTYDTWRTPEFDTFNETVTLFGPNREKLMSKFPMEIKKNKFGPVGGTPDWLRLEYVPHVLIDDKIYRLFVHNMKSKENLKKFLKIHGDQPLPTFVTQFSLVKDEESNIPSCILKEKMERDGKGNPILANVNLALAKSRELNAFIVGSKLMYAERNDGAAVVAVEEAFPERNPERFNRGFQGEYSPSGLGDKFDAEMANAQKPYAPPGFEPTKQLLETAVVVVEGKVAAAETGGPLDDWVKEQDAKKASKPHQIPG